MTWIPYPMTKGDASKVYPDEIRFPVETVPDAEEGGGWGEGEWYLLDLCEICVGHKLLVDICLVYLFVVFKAIKTKYNVLESPVIRYKETSK